MIMGAFIPGLRRKYPIHEYISALLLVIGLIFFTLADAQTSPNFSIVGVVMISGALVMDAFLGNLQEAIFTMNPDTTQVSFDPPSVLRLLAYWFLNGTVKNLLLIIISWYLIHSRRVIDVYVLKQLAISVLSILDITNPLVFSLADRDVILLDRSRLAFLSSTNGVNGRAVSSLDFLCRSK